MTVEGRGKYLAEQLHGAADAVVREFDRDGAMKVFGYVNDLLRETLGEEGPRAVVHRVHHWREMHPRCPFCGNEFEAEPRVHYGIYVVCDRDECWAAARLRMELDDSDFEEDDQ